eukprot:3918651-Pyramimonas_sp.AAC.1
MYFRHHTLPKAGASQAREESIYPEREPIAQGAGTNICASAPNAPELPARVPRPRLSRDWHPLWVYALFSRLTGSRDPAPTILPSRLPPSTYTSTGADGALCTPRTYGFVLRIQQTP